MIPVDKPVGPTSHDVVARARRALRTRRIGHTGTLDPFASGLLLLCVGSATRLAEYLTPEQKSYRARVRLGVATDTDDRTGTPVASSESWRTVDRSAVEEALARMTGTVRQRPPVFSAKKVGGVAMHRLARSGEAPVPEPVDVVIHGLQLLHFAPPALELDVVCSAGTYVRAIARDLGEALGTHAHLSELRRTRIGVHRVEDALTPAELDDDAGIQRARLSPLAAMAHLPRVDLNDTDAARVRQGMAIAMPAGEPRGSAIALAHAGRLLAIAQPEDGHLRPRKVFHD